MSFVDGLKTVVVATDLQGQNKAALEYAAKIANAYGARIVLAHGLDPLAYAALDGVPADVLEQLTEKARRALDTLGAELLQEGIPTHSEIRQGAIAETLIEVARQHQAGLIVIGSEGRDGAGPVLVGSIAEELVRHAPCAVMAVAADWNAGPNRPTPGGPVLLALEENLAAGAAAATAYSLAERFARPLLILHVRTAAEASGEEPAHVERLEEYGVQPGRGVLIQEMVKDGDRVEATMAAIAEQHPCILIVGAKRVSETPGPHGTAFALMARSRVPVLCVPPDTAVRGVASVAALAAHG